MTDESIAGPNDPAAPTTSADSTIPAEWATPRRVADAYVQALAYLDPLTAVYLGLNPEDTRLPDLSPDGLEAVADLGRRTLAELDAAEKAMVEKAAAGDAPGIDAVAERRCARLLRERLTASLAVHDAGEGLRTVRNLASPLHEVRDVFTLVPTATDEDWARIARRLERVPQALDGYRATLAEGIRQGLLSGPQQVTTVIGQLAEWLGTESGNGWFADFAAGGPQPLRPELDRAAASATAALTDLRDWLRDVYAPAAADTPDTVGRERYARLVRHWNGADVDLDEAYHWAWGEFRRLEAEMRAEAGRVLPGADPSEAMRYLEEEGPAIHGAEAARSHLQDLMEQAMRDLQGTHFDLAEPVRRVESMIAPPGSAAAPYYTAPSLDFSRPGRTWLPVRSHDRYPLWDLVSTWYHEGVPGHHLQLAQWNYVAGSLSTYQVSLGSVSANVEGWALYAERLMDELGYLTDPGARLGYLNAQMMRALRVIVDIGMHCRLDFPDDSPYLPGELMTPRAAREFFGQYCGLASEVLDSELVRYLGLPGQAIGYKLGERAWLAGREAARRARGDAFDLKAWHMAALSQGSLGLDDLVEELSRL
ncbi:DUF885 family protein [Streptomyces sp. SCUT-3]|uniref:DUF885 domain-containing protein n=1 Tax=unclassified Streptomyces TaxID=2593676 RepID=UPI000CB6AE27|nr:MULTISPECIES: DUF885 domain-containing protein [unclassified Streptomyces]MCZ2526052.1 DUF885 domain-containing protein [Streptomyces sp. HB2AG]PLW72095.1 DUF885 domain-containing protein [Streptomyces sp. DJ]QMV24010.1 DUF885 family protein [Streptomyces sp. SCUT-3]